MTTQNLTRSMLAAMIGAALALGTVASGEAQASQGHAKYQHDDDATAKAKAKRDEREQKMHANAAVDARTSPTAGHANVNATVNANERARVSATADLNQRNARLQAQADARARAERDQREERTRAQAQADTRARMQHEQQNQERVRANARLQEQARASANRNDNRGDERFRTVPHGQVVSAEAHRRNAERQAAHDMNRRNYQGDERRVAIERERERAMQYNTWHAQQQQVARQRAIALQRSNRLAQYRYQQQYYDRLRQMQLRDTRYDWNNDPFFNSAPTYRYYRSGSYYQVNNYAADMLRNAVQLGYQQGVQAGQADRYDHWRADYRNSFVYQDASLGYGGYYVDRNEYEHYFREGFRRGYEDGYYQRRQYGRYDNGNANILGNVLSLILNFQNL